MLLARRKGKSVPPGDCHIPLRTGQNENSYKPGCWPGLRKMSLCRHCWKEHKWPIALQESLRGFQKVPSKTGHWGNHHAGFPEEGEHLIMPRPGRPCLQQVSQCCCDRGPQTRWLQTPLTRSLTDLAARSESTSSRLFLLEVPCAPLYLGPPRPPHTHVPVATVRRVLASHLAPSYEDGLGLAGKGGRDGPVTSGRWLAAAHHSPLSQAVVAVGATIGVWMSWGAFTTS